MKKQVILKSLLILLPVLAVGLATTADSVLVFDSLTGVTEHYSYFDVLPVAQYQLLTPLAGMLCIASLILAAVYLAAKKMGCLKASSITALLAAAIAVIPVVQNGDIRVIPNVGLPILMLLHYALAYYIAKNADKLAQEKNAPRLKKK